MSRARAAAPAARQAPRVIGVDIAGDGPDETFLGERRATAPGVVRDPGHAVEFVLPLKTTNPNNGSQGFSREASFAKARRRKEQRGIAALATRARGPFTFPVVVTITRLAPSAGLDPHDGLGAALKGVIDGIADGLGLKDDRDPRVRWVLDQRRSGRAVWGVEVRIEARAA